MSNEDLFDEDLFDEEFECEECEESLELCECEDDDPNCGICGHGLIDDHLSGCPNGDTSGEFLLSDERGTRLISTKWAE